MAQEEKRSYPDFVTLPGNQSLNGDIRIRYRSRLHAILKWEALPCACVALCEKDRSVLAKRKLNDSQFQPSYS